jgi:uncharacterized protein
VDLSCEKQAAINALNHFGAFDLKGILLRVDGKVSAFGISAPLTPEMATLQYEKALGSIKGLYQYFDNALRPQALRGFHLHQQRERYGHPRSGQGQKVLLPRQHGPVGQADSEGLVPLPRESVFGFRPMSDSTPLSD